MPLGGAGQVLLDLRATLLVAFGLARHAPVHVLLTSATIEFRGRAVQALISVAFHIVSEGVVEARCTSRSPSRSEAEYFVYQLGVCGACVPRRTGPEPHVL